MARYDVHRNSDGPGYLLDCQTDLLSYLNTRLVVPLLPLGMAPIPADRLNPIFAVKGQPHAMMTHFATAVPASALGPSVLSLDAESFTIINAWDMLLTGI